MLSVNLTVKVSYISLLIDSIVFTMQHFGLCKFGKLFCDDIIFFGKSLLIISEQVILLSELYTGATELYTGATELYTGVTELFSGVLQLFFDLTDFGLECELDGIVVHNGK